MWKVKALELFFAGWFVHLTYVFEVFLCMLCLYTIALIFDLYRVMKLDTTNTLIRELYAKNTILQHCLESRNLPLVIALLFNYGVNISDFEQLIGCLNLFLFATDLQFLLCCILWEASGEMCSFCFSHVGIYLYWLSS